MKLCGFTKFPVQRKKYEENSLGKCGKIWKKAIFAFYKPCPLVACGPVSTRPVAV
jgi:hypothetical protein